MKRCSACNIERTLDLFGNDRRRKDGKYPQCLACSRAQKESWLAANPEKHKASCAKWYAKNKDARRRIWTKHHYKKNYGITYEEFLAMCQQQDYKCSICYTAVEVDGGMANNKAVVDHCHVSGNIRSILCSQCNWGLGKFRDSPEFLRAAANYLEKHN